MDREKQSQPKPAKTTLATAIHVSNSVCDSTNKNPPHGCAEGGALNSTAVDEVKANVVVHLVRIIYQVI